MSWAFPLFVGMVHGPACEWFYRTNRRDHCVRCFCASRLTNTEPQVFLKLCKIIFPAKKEKQSRKHHSWGFLLVSHPSSLPHTKPRPANHGLLRGPIGRGQRGAAPVLVGRGAAERGTGRGTVRVREGQEGSSHALTTGIAWDDVYHGLKKMSCWGQNLDI